MSKFLKSIGRVASSIAKGATPVAKIAVPIVVTSFLTHRTVKAVAIDAAKDAIN